MFETTIRWIPITPGVHPIPEREVLFLHRGKVYAGCYTMCYGWTGVSLQDGYTQLAKYNTPSHYTEIAELSDQIGFAEEGDESNP